MKDSSNTTEAQIELTKDNIQTANGCTVLGAFAATQLLKNKQVTFYLDSLGNVCGAAPHMFMSDELLCSIPLAESTLILLSCGTPEEDIISYLKRREERLGAGK